MNYYQNKILFCKHQNYNGSMTEGFTRSIKINNIHIYIVGETIDGNNFIITENIKYGSNIFQNRYKMTLDNVKNLLKKEPNDLLKNINLTKNLNKNLSKNKIINHKKPNKNNTIKINKTMKPKDLYNKYSFNQLLLKAKSLGIKVTKKNGGYLNKKEISKKIIIKIKKK